MRLLKNISFLSFCWLCTSCATLFNTNFKEIEVQTSELVTIQYDSFLIAEASSLSSITVPRLEEDLVNEARIKKISFILK